MTNQPLKEEITVALAALQESVSSNDRKRIKSVARKLKNSLIPENDFEKVFNFIYLFVKQIPNAINSPNSEPLKILCLRCVNHLRLPSEIQKNNRPSSMINKKPSIESTPFSSTKNNPPGRNK